MTDTIVVLIEDALSPADVDKLIALHTDEVLEYRVLVPADTERPLLPWIVDSLSLGELREAWDRAVGKEPTERQAKTTAQEQLAATLTAFEAAGRRAVGTVVSDDPIPALRATPSSWPWPSPRPTASVSSPRPSATGSRWNR